MVKLRKDERIDMSKSLRERLGAPPLKKREEPKRRKYVAGSWEIFYGHLEDGELEF